MSLSNYATLYFDKPSSNFQYVAPNHTFRRLLADGMYQDTLCISNQNIGIGTTSPNYTLDIHGTLSTSSNLYVAGTIFASSVTGITYLGSTPTRVTDVVSSSTNTFTVVVDGLHQFTENDVDIYVNGLKLGYISGNMNDYMVAYDQSASSTLVTITLNQPADIGDVVEISVHQPIFDNGSTSFTSSSAWVNVQGTSNIVYNDGNVGIGTNNPSHELHVEGSVYAHHIIASNVVSYNEPIMQTFTPVQVPHQTYYKTFSWIYRGADENVRALKNIYISSYIYTSCNVQSYIESPNFGYDVKLVNVLNNQTIIQKTMSNVLPQVNELSLSNLGASNTTLEMQVRKKSHGEFVYIDGITFGY